MQFPFYKQLIEQYLWALIGTGLHAIGWKWVLPIHTVFGVLCIFLGLLFVLNAVGAAYKENESRRRWDPVVVEGGLSKKKRQA